MYTKTKGLVVGEVSINESDKMLTLLTGDLGKISVRARGAKKTVSKFAVSCQLLAYSDFEIYIKGGRYTVTSADVISSFYGVSENLKKLAAANYFAETARFFSPEEDDCSHTLSLLANTLHILEKSQKDIEIIKSVYEWKLAELSGFRPSTQCCVKCGDTDALNLLAAEGILVCDNCKETKGGLRLTPASLTALRYILSSPLKNAFSFKIPPEDMATLSRVGENYIRSITGKDFTTLGFYHSVINF